MKDTKVSGNSTSKPQIFFKITIEENILDFFAGERALFLWIVSLDLLENPLYRVSGTIIESIKCLICICLQLISIVFII